LCWYAANRGAYGWPRIWRELHTRGILVGKQRVQRVMQQHGIRARGKRRSPQRMPNISFIVIAAAGTPAVSLAGFFRSAASRFDESQGQLLG
jgi:transposase InsO family protein